MIIVNGVDAPSRHLGTLDLSTKLPAKLHQRCVDPLFCFL